jgi:hypothetical protein
MTAALRISQKKDSHFEKLDFVIKKREMTFEIFVYKIYKMFQ